MSGAICLLERGQWACVHQTVHVNTRQAQSSFWSCCGVSQKVTVSGPCQCADTDADSLAPSYVYKCSFISTRALPSMGSRPSSSVGPLGGSLYKYIWFEQGFIPNREIYNAIYVRSSTSFNIYLTMIARIYKYIYMRGWAFSGYSRI